MRKKLITLTVAAIMLLPGLTGRLHAGETQNGGPGVKQIAVSEESSGTEKTDKEEAKAAGVLKAEEAKQAEEEKKAAEEAKKNIVAKVNGTDINMFMLTRGMNRVAPKYIKEGETPTPEITAKIRNKALNRLIFEELAVQEAIKQGINPAPEAIEKVMGQIKENLGSEQAYREYLVKNNLTEDTLKKLIERSQRHELITAREVYGKVKVDEKLLQDEYEKEKGKYILPENLVVDDVWFMKVKDDAARKKAEEVLNTIKRKDNDFGKLVLDGTFIVRKITVIQEKYPEIHKAMTGMKVGDLSGIIGDRDGFHIIKVLKNDSSRQATFEEARGTLEPKFLVPAQEQRKEEWEKELKKNANIEILPEGTKN